MRRVTGAPLLAQVGHTRTAPHAFGGDVHSLAQFRLTRRSMATDGRTMSTVGQARGGPARDRSSAVDENRPGERRMRAREHAPCDVRPAQVGYTPTASCGFGPDGRSIARRWPAVPRGTWEARTVGDRQLRHSSTSRRCSAARPELLRGSALYVRRRRGEHGARSQRGQHSARRSRGGLERSSRRPFRVSCPRTVPELGARPQYLDAAPSAETASPRPSPCRSTAPARDAQNAGLTA